ncbi:synaptic vesicle glycoprotein 2B-like isoform X2 [Lycorma delicatula]|uniref:synaptic vesicle glycoprotein 2B-like isoform X2 n=1 Tax=Lycorma delicatula TaxID=130591 RepID=UPI003F517F57
MVSRQQGNHEEISIDEALDKIGVGSFHYRVSIIGGIILLSSYLSVGVVTFFMPAAQCDLEMKSEQKGYLAAISLVGLILSAHLWGFLSDTLGRRYIIIRCLLCDGLLYLITMLTPSYYLILVLRFFNGVASCGGVVSVYAFVGEFQPTHFRPRSLMIVSLVATSSYILLPAVAWLTIPSKWTFELYPGLTLKSWRLFYIFNGIPSILSAILLLFTPESPKFLIAKGENEKAIEVLHTIYKSNNNNNDDSFTINNIKSNEHIGKIRDDKSKIMAFFFLMWDQTFPLLKKPHRLHFLLLSLSLFTTLFRRFNFVYCCCSSITEDTQSTYYSAN